MGQICDLETVEPQEILQGLRNVLYCIIRLHIPRLWEEKIFFLQSFNLLECVVVGLLTVEGLCSLLFK